MIGAERFLAEIRTTANLQHPHILPLFDSGTADGFLYYVMPYVEGESLRNRLVREKQLPIPEAVQIATEVAAALDYVHRHGVIHSDIKPENVLLHDGQALVADFGIALAASRAGPRRDDLRDAARRATVHRSHRSGDRGQGGHRAAGAPDGKYFVMLRPVEENRDLIVVVNWREELRRRTGRSR